MRDTRRDEVGFKMGKEMFSEYKVSHERDVWKFNRDLWDKVSFVILKMSYPEVEICWTGDKSDGGFVRITNNFKSFSFSGGLLYDCGGTAMSFHETHFGCILMYAQCFTALMNCVRNDWFVSLSCLAFFGGTIFRRESKIRAIRKGVFGGTIGIGNFEIDTEEDENGFWLMLGEDEYEMTFNMACVRNVFVSSGMEWYMGERRIEDALGELKDDIWEEDELDFVRRCGGTCFERNESFEGLLGDERIDLNGRFGARLSFGGQDGLTVDVELVGGAVWCFSLWAILVMEVD